MRLKVVSIVLLSLIVLVGGVWLSKNWSDDDIRMAIVGSQGITIRTISWQRRMVNELIIDPKVEVWIPKGMGWYKAGDISKVLKQENNPKLAKDILLYNFGFVPKILTINGEEVSWGLMNDIRYFLTKNQMMIKKETVPESLLKSKDNLDEILPRDFADGLILREDIRVSINNLGQSNGLANFVASFLSRAGVTILALDTVDGSDKSNICEIRFGPNTKTSYVGRLISESLSECKTTPDDGLNRGEIELYFGDGYAKMINYESYNLITKDL